MKITTPTNLLHSIRATMRPRLAVGASMAAGIALALMLTAPTPNAAETTAANAAPASPTVFARTGFADLVERVRPAVVNVSTRTRVTRTSMQNMPFQLPKGSPFAERFREYFEKHSQRSPGGEAPQASGMGSGFIVDADGYVVTNHHVIKDADEIIVTLSDGTELKAQVVGHDSKTDLALLKVQNDKPLPFVDFGDSDHARVGDWVVAVGSPFGLGGTVTAGILSARGRDIHSGSAAP